MLKNFRTAVKGKVAEAAASAKTSAAQAEYDSDLKGIMKGYAFEGDGLRGSTHSGGHAMAWASYNAVREVSKERVTVHILNKNTFGGEALDRDAKAGVIERMKTGLNQQVKIIHPGVLRVIEPVRERGQLLMYVTEPVLGSLANMLGDHTNVEVVRGRLDTYLTELSPQEKKFALFQVAEAMAFLHGQVRALHLNLTPAAIYISATTGDWKIGGFDFSIAAQPGAQPNGNFKQVTGSDMFDTSINLLLGPDLSYGAPDYVKNLVVNPYADLFSYGCVVYEVLASKPGRRLPLIRAGPNLSLYNTRVLEIQNPHNAFSLEGCDLNEAETVRILVAPRHGDMTASVAAVLASTPLFSDKGLKCLIYISRLVDKSEQQKVSFFKDLYGVVGNYDARIAKGKVLPSLVSELGSMPPQYILPIVLRLAPVLDAGDVEATLLPHVVPFMKDGGCTPQLAAIILERLTDLMQKLTPPAIARHIVPFVSGQLDSNASTALMDLLLSVSSKGVFDQDTVNSLAPKIVRLAVKHADAKLRAQAVSFLTDLNHLVLRVTTTEVVLPALRGALLNETDATVRTKVLEYYTKASQTWDMEVVSGVVTHMATALGNSSLRDDQFSSIYAVTLRLLEELKQKRERKKVEPAMRAPPPRPAEPTPAAPPKQEASWEAALPFANAGPAPAPAAAPAPFGGFAGATNPSPAAAAPAAAPPRPDAFAGLGSDFGRMHVDPTSAGAYAKNTNAKAGSGHNSPTNTAASDWKPDWSFGSSAPAGNGNGAGAANDGGFADFGAFDGSFGSAAPAPPAKPAAAAAPAVADPSFGLADWTSGVQTAAPTPTPVAPSGGGSGFPGGDAFGAFGTPAAKPPAPTPQAQAPATSGFADFGAFGAPPPAGPAPSAGGGFADFGNFGAPPAPAGGAANTNAGWSTFGSNPAPPPPAQQPQPAGGAKSSMDDLFGF